MNEETTMTPSQYVHEKLQLALWGCGIGFGVLFFAGLLPFAGFIPPPSPELTGAELMAEYGPRLNWVKLGIITGLLGATLLVPWSAMVSLQIARMEQGRRVPLWALFSFSAGVVNAVAFILPFIFWAGAFYRADRSPELVQLINDMTWIEFLLFFPTFSMQLFCLAMAGFTQKQGPQVFPRWFLYLNLWMAVVGSTGAICLFFFSGPFAWNGVVGFYVPVGSYVPFLIVTFVQFYRAIRAEKHSYGSPDPIADSGGVRASVA
jgi:MFS family permease